MKGNEELLYQYMEGHSKRFIIPVYQRNYDWTKDQCKQLYDDLVRISKENTKRHFFGSIVSSMNEGGGQQEYLIIDGQQRLTTVSLLLLAMYKILEEEILTTKDLNLKTKLFDEYLVDKYEKKETRIKLKPVKNDAEAFNILVDKFDELILDSNITTNYEYFYNRILREEISISELYESFKKLEIINIFLGPEDNPQLIFESLNSTGLDLSEGDKIRNYILMDVRPNELQEEYYEKYWHKIEKATKYDVSSFIRDYLSIKLQYIPVIKKTYQEFKKYHLSLSIGKEELLEDLLAYAERYEQIITGKSKMKTIEPVLTRLLFYEAKVIRPFVLEVLRLAESSQKKEAILSEEEVLEILNTVESYIFRRQICDMAANALNKIFASLHNEIMQIDGSADLYVDKFKYILSKKQGKGIFPDNQSFLKSLENKDIYSMRSKNKQYLIERYENWGTKEVKDVYKLISNGTYTIEHIMPQNLSYEWQASLGDNWQEIHEEWVHRLANLTLTAYNSKYQNSSFERKRDVENGYRDSGIRMNQRLANFDRWTEIELKDRNEQMLSKARKIWPMVETSYEPENKLEEKVALADEINLTGRLISEFEFLGARTSVKSWQEMYLRTIELIIDDNPHLLINKINNKDSDLKYYIENHQSSKSYKKIYDGIYINTNTSTNTKIIGLKKIFDLYGVDENELVFYLRSKD
ncbi:DUF262 domain-containing protein [uncultured Anaerococcus sp.]|uniref:DUF262 domain-containing protein n=1 Tax=uncultured Anaerococcus sp. TaxID=293428 RepID=UPI002611FD98|nr:DUF262 domain-containing protein [uncultured Anaerococcus sp.]